MSLAGSVVGPIIVEGLVDVIFYVNSFYDISCSLIVCRALLESGLLMLSFSSRFIKSVPLHI